MSSAPLPSTVPNRPFHWPALLQLIFSLLGALLLLGGALVIGMVTFLQHLGATAQPDPTQAFMIAGSLAFAGALLLPSAWFAWRHLHNPAWQPQPTPMKRGFIPLLTLVVLILVAGALLLGNWISQDNQLAWLLLPPLNILASGLPALWLVYIGTYRLIPGSPWRRWGAFGSGLVLGPLIILVLELLVLVVLGVLAVVLASLDPSISSQLNDLVLHLQSASRDPEAILRLMMPILLHPAVLLIAFAFISLIVPLIEESLKPIGTWFMLGKKPTPTQGFAYGLLSGTGFGLFENLGNTSGGGDVWALVAASRISTLLLHGLTAGLVGWALASAVSQRRYLRLFLTFLFAILVHGLWNGMAVLGAITSLKDIGGASIPPILTQFSRFSTSGIIALGVFNLILFFVFTGMLRGRLSSQNSATGQVKAALVPPQPGNIPAEASAPSENIPAEISQIPSNPSSEDDDPTLKPENPA